jgi:NtrC-family two-component system response regulator AlgB
MSESFGLSVLLVDDDKNIRQMLKVSLAGLGCDVTAAESAEEAERQLRSKKFDVLLTDFKLGGATGIDLLKQSKTLDRPPVCLLMTAFASFENAVNAVREGAFDYLPKPFSNSQLSHLLKKVKTVVDLKAENDRLRKGVVRPDFFSGMTSPAMLRLQEFVGRVAPTEATVLLIGESGTGKSELAKIIHSRSSRGTQPFIVVNCTTLTESLLESELFGHVRGAFTGAVQDHAGKLEIANHGTVFIDEIGDLSMSAQTRLLRFLQERVVERVGSNKAIPLDVRVVAATNRNLEEAVKNGTFREDLYFRLNIFECTLVPLRFRREDLPVLIQRFIREISALSHAKELKKIPDGVMKSLLDYSWPGNIRELRNTIERVMVLAADREVSLDDLPDSVRKGSTLKAAPGPGHLATLEEIERAHIEKVLSIEANQERAADILGITTVTLWRKRKQYGLP